MHKLEIHSEAEEELMRASLYYEEKRVGLGEEFLMESKKPSIKFENIHWHGLSLRVNIDVI